MVDTGPFIATVGVVAGIVGSVIAWRTFRRDFARPAVDVQLLARPMVNDALFSDVVSRYQAIAKLMPRGERLQIVSYSFRFGGIAEVKVEIAPIWVERGATYQASWSLDEVVLYLGMGWLWVTKSVRLPLKLTASTISRLSVGFQDAQGRDFRGDVGSNARSGLRGWYELHLAEGTSFIELLARPAGSLKPLVLLRWRLSRRSPVLGVAVRGGSIAGVSVCEPILKSLSVDDARSIGEELLRLQSERRARNLREVLDSVDFAHPYLRETFTRMVLRIERAQSESHGQPEDDGTDGGAVEFGIPLSSEWDHQIAVFDLSDFTSGQLGDVGKQPDQDPRL